MEKYILSFRATLKTLLDRENISQLLKKRFPQILSISLDLDDKQFYLRVNTSERIEQSIQQYILDHGQRISFVSAVTVKSDIDQAATA
ncbi:hypothetical protein [Sphingobacterium kyonggiense]